MRIKQVVEADFRQSDASVFDEYTRLNKEFVASLNSNDVIVFVSKSGNQLLFIHGWKQVETNGAIVKERRVLPSTRYRLSGGSWNPLMLRNYAEDAGMRIEGLKLFEEHYKELKE